MVTGHHRTTADIAKSAVCFYRRSVYVSHPVSLRLSSAKCLVSLRPAWHMFGIWTEIICYTSVIHPLYIRYTSEDRRGAYVEQTPQEIWRWMTADGPRTPAYDPQSYQTFHVWLPHNQRTVAGACGTDTRRFGKISQFFAKFWMWSERSNLCDSALSAVTIQY